MMLGVLGTFAAATQAGANPILYGTGLGPEGTTDPNYTILNPNANEVNAPLIQYAAGDLNGQGSVNLIQGGNGAGSGYWVPNLPNGKWISPFDGVDTNPWLSDAQPYDYVFQTIVGGIGSGTVSGLWSSDNAGQIVVNGVVIYSVTDPLHYEYYTPFTLSVYAGEAVDFVVNNQWNGSVPTGNPAGLLVATPDGGTTVGLLGGALLGLQILRRKLSR